MGPLAPLLLLPTLFPLPRSSATREREEKKFPSYSFAFHLSPLALFLFLHPFTGHIPSLCQPRMGNLKYESVYLALGVPVDINDKILLRLYPSFGPSSAGFFTPPGHPTMAA